MPPADEAKPIVSVPLFEIVNGFTQLYFTVCGELGRGSDDLRERC